MIRLRNCTFWMPDSNQPDTLEQKEEGFANPGTMIPLTQTNLATTHPEKDIGWCHCPPIASQKIYPGAPNLSRNPGPKTALNHEA